MRGRLSLIFGIIVLLVACSSAGSGTGGAGGVDGTNNIAGSSGLAASAGISGAGTAEVGRAGAGGVGNASGVGGVSIGGTSGGGSGGVGDVGGAAGSGGATVTCKPPTDVFSPIEKLSQTGCVDAADPRKPSASAVSYEVNSPLWSDSADKQRAFVLPAGSKIHVRNCATTPADCPNGNADDGRWDFPAGSVMIKTFMFDGKLVETRLFMHLDADNWVGYSYEWDEAQTEAKIVSTDRVALDFNTGKRTVTWHYPSQDDCLNCHNRAAGSTLGPETAQMNRIVAGVNQIDRLAALSVFDTPPPKPYKAALVTPYAGQLGSPAADATTEQKARSYLHANCGFCHRPGGNQANFDLRNDVALKDMKICNADAQKGAIPSAPGKTKIMVPGMEMDSVMWLRMNEPDENNGRMPQIASYQVDASAVTLVGDWIKSVSACPQ